MGGNAPTIAQGANANAVSREGRESHATTHQNKCPKGRSNRAPGSGAIAIFSILTSPVREVKNRMKRVRVGSIHFGYISNIDIYTMQTNTHLWDAR